MHTIYTRLPAQAISLLSLPCYYVSACLLDAVKPGPVHGNLIVHLVRLTNNPLNVLILRIHFLAHGPTQMVESPGRSVERVC